jgi:hypothetical protein
MQTLINKISVAPSQGLKKTLDLMQYLEQLSFERVDFVKFVFEKFSSNCAACIPGKIYNYIKNNFTYQSDDPFDEVLTAPYVLLNTKRGDCDDFALFAKTCIDILGGFNSNYILLGRQKNEFSHVACFVNRGAYNGKFIDPVYIDGANENFNIIPIDYKFYKLV